MLDPFVLLLMATAPGISLAAWLFFRKKRTLDSLRLLLRLFLMGMLIAFPVVIAERMLGSINPGGALEPVWRAFVVAALTEEFFKFMVVKGSVFQHPLFEKPWDGILYCAFVSLGFATLENILYVFILFDSDRTIWLQRAVFSVPAHLMYAITMGWYVSIAKFSHYILHRKGALSKALWMPVLLHGFYDFILLSNSAWILALFAPFLIWLWVSNLMKLKKMLSYDSASIIDIRQADVKTDWETDKKNRDT